MYGCLVAGNYTFGRIIFYNMILIRKDEIIPHLDPDTIQPPDKEKKLNQRPVRISAWKLTKLDSNEAAKAAAKARASSSVLRPISSRRYPHDADHSSGRSSPVKAGTSRSYPPSQARKEDNMSILSSPQHSNLATSPMMLQQQQSSNGDHFNPMYEQSPWSAKEREGIHVVMRNDSLAMVEGFWDQEAGRFVASSGQSSGECVLYSMEAPA